MRGVLDQRTFLPSPSPHIKLGISVDDEIIDQKNTNAPIIMERQKEAFVLVRL